MSWLNDLLKQAARNQTMTQKWLGKVPSESALEQMSAKRSAMFPRKRQYDIEDAIGIYKTSGYGVLNELQRNGELSRKARDYYMQFQEGQDTPPEVANDVLRKWTSNPLLLKRDVPIYRGTEVLRRAEAEDLYGTGFGSFSYSPLSALEFSGGSAPSRIGVLSRISPQNMNAVRGLDISDNRFIPDASTGIENEYELLLAPNQGFRVNDAAMDEERRLLLDLIYDPELRSGIPLYSNGGAV